MKAALAHYHPIHGQRGELDWNCWFGERNLYFGEERGFRSSACHEARPITRAIPQLSATVATLPCWDVVAKF